MKPRKLSMLLAKPMLTLSKKVIDFDIDFFCKHWFVGMIQVFLFIYFYFIYILDS